MKRHSFIAVQILFCISLFIHSLALAHGLSADTWVQNCDGTWNTSIKSICHQVHNGKQQCVASYDLDTQAYYPHAKIRRVGKSCVDRYMAFSCRSGCTSTDTADITCSLTQEFYCTDTNTWKHAEVLEVGDTLCSKHGPQQITYIKIIHQELAVYALEIEHTHTFYIGRDSLLTHNMLLPIDIISVVIPISAGVSSAVAGSMASILGPVATTVSMAASTCFCYVVQQLLSDWLPVYQIHTANDISLYNRTPDSGNQDMQCSAKEQKSTPPGNNKKPKGSATKTVLKASAIKKAEELANNIAKEKAQHGQHVTCVPQNVAPKRESISSTRVRNALNNKELKQLEQQCIKIQRNDGKRPGTWEDIPNLVNKYDTIEAETMQRYNTYRNSNDDIEKIVKNTGIRKSIIQRIKDHVFNNEHIKLETEKKVELIGKFDVDIDTANAWDRLQHGNYMNADLELLKHEYLESLIMGDKIIEYTEAHTITDFFFNWGKAL